MKTGANVSLTTRGHRYSGVVVVPVNAHADAGAAQMMAKDISKYLSVRVTVMSDWLGRPSLSLLPVATTACVLQSRVCTPPRFNSSTDSSSCWFCKEVCGTVRDLQQAVPSDGMVSSSVTLKSRCCPTTGDCVRPGLLLVNKELELHQQPDENETAQIKQLRWMINYPVCGEYTPIPMGAHARTQNRRCRRIDVRPPANGTVNYRKCSRMRFRRQRKKGRTCGFYI